MPKTNRQIKAKYNRLHPEKVREWYQNNKDKVKGYQLKRRFGITIEQFKLLKEVQNNKCAICGKPEMFTSKGDKIKDLAVDHNHTTGKVRGLLCSACNVVIGLVEEKVETLEAIIKYIQNHA